jgi:hypothetical protein
MRYCCDCQRKLTDTLRCKICQEDIDRPIEVTCSVCSGKIPVRRDGRLRLCKCKNTGIDVTPEYSRAVGLILKEWVLPAGRSVT